MQDRRCANATFAVVDVDTTGLHPVRDRIVEVACLRMESGAIVERFATLVDPGMPIPAAATAIHGIADADVAGSPRLQSLATTSRPHDRL